MTITVGSNFGGETGNGDERGIAFEQGDGNSPMVYLEIFAVVCNNARPEKHARDYTAWHIQSITFIGACK